MHNRDSSLNKNGTKRNSCKEYRNGHEIGQSILSIAGANSFRIINSNSNHQEINGQYNTKVNAPLRKRT